jgi:hypothetical protein
MEMAFDMVDLWNKPIWVELEKAIVWSFNEIRRR